MPEITRTMTEVRLGQASEHTILTPDDMKGALESGEITAVYKYGVAERDDPGGVLKDVHTLEGKFLKSGRPTSRAVITSSAVDRDWDVVHTSGMIVTAGYRDHPVVMPMHQYREPAIGFTRKITQYMNHAIATWEWCTEIPETDAARFYALWSQRVLNCTSIGFTIPNAESWEYVSERKGFDFLAWEILEHSVVSIPANQDAVRTDGMKEYMEVARDMIFEGPSPVLRKAFEQATHQKVYAAGKTEKEAEQVNGGPDGTEPLQNEHAHVEGVEFTAPEGVLRAFEAGILDKDGAVQAIKAIQAKAVEVIEAERDEAQLQLLALSSAVINRNEPEV